MVEIRKGIGKYIPIGGTNDAISRGANLGEYAGNPLIDENMEYLRNNNPNNIKTKKGKGKRSIDRIIEDENND